MGSNFKAIFEALSKFVDGVDFISSSPIFTWIVIFIIAIVVTVIFEILKGIYKFEIELLLDRYKKWRKSSIEKNNNDKNNNEKSEDKKVEDEDEDDAENVSSD